ncbi:hypothetical protein Tco_1225452 [Tanacetum coccineum]
MIKEHDQQAKVKATPRRLAYADSNKEALARSLARGFFDRFSLESFGTSHTYEKTRSASKSQRSPSKSKEPAYLRRSRRLKDRSTTKEKARRERSKPRGKRSRHQETSSDFEYDEGLEDTYKDLNAPYKRPNPTPFTQIITRFKYHQRAKLLRNIRVYEGNKDPEDHLGIFSAAAEQEVWPMPVWCKNVCQTLCGAARNWFDDLDPKKVHGIKRRHNEGLQAFMDRFKSQSLHIKGVPPVLRISSFMHGHGHPKLAKKFNDKIPKTVDEMFERVRAFIRGEVAARDKGHNTNDCYQIKKQIEEAVASGKPFEEERSGLTDELTFPAIPQNQLTDKPIILEGVIAGKQKMQSSAGRFLKRNVSSSRNNRPSSNFGKGRKKQNGANGVRDNKMSFTIRCHNRKDRNEKPQREKVFRWLKEGMIRKVQHPVWVANTIPVKLVNGTWKVLVDYSSLNKVCAKDMYPFLEEGEELASIMGYPYKCFLRLPKEYIQVRMA